VKRCSPYTAVPVEARPVPHVQGPACTLHLVKQITYFNLVPWASTHAHKEPPWRQGVESFARSCHQLGRPPNKPTIHQSLKDAARKPRLDFLLAILTSIESLLSVNILHSLVWKDEVLLLVGPKAIFGLLARHRNARRTR
jgi:hypothetical protein